MNKYEHKNDKTVQLLKQLPSVEDKRSSDYIYQKIQNKTESSKKGRPHFIPVLSAAAGLLLLIILLPTMLNQFNDNLTKEEAESGSIVMESAEHDQAYDNNRELKEESLNDQYEGKSIKTAVYEQDLQNQDVYTFGFLSDEAIAVPISILGSKRNQESWLQNYQEVAKSFSSANYGFQDLNPLFQAMELESEQIIHVTMTPENSMFIHSNNAQLLFQYTFQDKNIELVHVTDEEGNPVEMGNYGEIDFEIMDVLRKPYYLFRDSYKSYLVPGDIGTDNIEEAFQLMKEKPNENLQSALADNVFINVQDKSKSAITIQFSDELNLSEGDPLENMLMLEGILLTAKEFGYKEVSFERVIPTEWEGFNFNQPITVPYSANLIREE